MLGGPSPGPKLNPFGTPGRRRPPFIVHSFRKCVQSEITKDMLTRARSRLVFACLESSLAEMETFTGRKILVQCMWSAFLRMRFPPTRKSSSPGCSRTWTKPMGIGLMSLGSLRPLTTPCTPQIVLRTPITFQGAGSNAFTSLISLNTVSICSSLGTVMCMSDVIL